MRTTRASRATLINLRDTLRGGLRTGTHRVSVAPVTIVVVNERPAPRPRSSYNAGKLTEQAQRAENGGRYGRAAAYYLRALDAYPLDLRPVEKKQRTLLRRAVIRCEKLEVLQHCGRAA